MDTRLYDKFNGLYELLQYDFIKILLKNDSHIYGDILRDILIENKTFPEYCEHKKTINIWSNISLIDVIERDLHKYIIDCEQMSQHKINKLINSNINQFKTIIDNSSHNGNSDNNSDNNKNSIINEKIITNYDFVKIKCYHCILFDKVIIMNVTYIDSKFPNILNYTIKYLLDIVFDINLLVLDRTGLNLLFIPYSLKYTPVPIYQIFNQIKNRKLTIIEENLIHSEYSFNLILQYIKNGWKINNDYIKFITPNNPIFINSDDRCTICFGELTKKPVIMNINEYKNMKDKWIILPCNHIFHYKCWLNKLKKELKENKHKLICSGLSCNYCIKISECFL